MAPKTKPVKQAAVAPTDLKQLKRKAADEIDDIFGGKSKKKVNEIDDIFGGTSSPSAVPANKTRVKGSTSSENRNTATKSQSIESSFKTPGRKEVAGASNNNEGNESTEEQEEDEPLLDTDMIAAKIKEARTQRPKPIVETIQFQEAGASPASIPQPSHDEDGFANSRGASSGKRKTEDGLNLYYTTDLNIGKGGDTPQCPFDCWCCY
ncbi:hypothetical protein BC832DRAFT_543796 [Gaertneriomyces semiglobifer]|nr:hypothetical protein BC832DRAFT_543796 [Gaertneriomyces semiglobifer]